MVAGRNERKALVLGMLTRQESVTSRDLVDRWGLSPSDAAQLLANYYRQNLISRERDSGPGPPVYRYRITSAGLRKVEWMVGQALLQPAGQEHLPGLAPVEPSERIWPVVRKARIRPKLRS